MKYAQVDAAEKLRGILREAVPNVRFCDTLPDGWNSNHGLVVVVTNNGTPVSNRAFTTENVHIAVHGANKPHVRKSLAMLDAWLVRPRSRALGMIIKPASGIIVTPSSLKGGFIAAATYKISMVRSL